MKRMMNSKRGVMFIALILFFLVLVIFIFAAPALFAIITIGAAQTGTATSFVIKSMPIVLLLMLVFWLLSKLSSG